MSPYGPPFWLSIRIDTRKQKKRRSPRARLYVRYFRESLAQDFQRNGPALTGSAGPGMKSLIIARSNYSAAVDDHHGAGRGCEQSLDAGAKVESIRVGVERCSDDEKIDMSVFYDLGDFLLHSITDADFDLGFGVHGFAQFLQAGHDFVGLPELSLGVLGRDIGR